MTKADTENPLLKLLFELGPLAVFFVVNAYAGIFKATGAFMLATVIALIGSRVFLKKVAVMPIVTAFFVLLMGGLTLYLGDEFFIKIKPTIVNLLFASLLFGGLFFGEYLFKWVMSDALRLTDEGWRKITIRWASFFVFLAILNELVWRNFSTDTWVSFKFFGIMPLTILFAAAQYGIIRDHLIEDDAVEK